MHKFSGKSRSNRPVNPDDAAGAIKANFREERPGSPLFQRIQLSKHLLKHFKRTSTNKTSIYAIVIGFGHGL